MSKIIPWSFSSWSAYKTCPRQFYELRIAKNFQQPESEALKWGNYVHKKLELHVKEGMPIPENMKRIKPVVEKILNGPGENLAELELACTIDLQPTGFWNNDAWARGKGDLVKVNGKKAINFDYKTGKVKPNSLQLDLMAALTFAKFPEVQEAATCFVWFQAPSKPTIAKYKREDSERLVKQFESGVQDMLWSEENNVWPERPSGLCRPSKSGYAGCPVLTCKFNYYYKGKK